MYFTLGGNGTYLIKHRAGDADSRDSHDRGLDAERCDREGGREREEHRQAPVVVGAQKIQYMINGKEVYSMDRAKAVGAGTCWRHGWHCGHSREPQSGRAYFGL